MTMATSHDQDRYLVARLTRESEVMGDFERGDAVLTPVASGALRGTVVGAARNQLGQPYGVAVHFDARGDVRGVAAARLHRLTAAA